MKGATRSIITWLAVAAMATLVLACEKATPAPAATPAAPAPEEPTPPEPTLLGTWEQVTEWDDDDGEIRPVTIRLVFTESGKAFWHVAQLELSGEDRHDPYGHIADWSFTEDTITKTFFHDNDDDNQWESGTIDKSYYLTDAGSVLFVHHWESDEAEDAFERYTRVQDPVPSNPTLLGTWEAEGVYHEHDDLVGDYVVAGKKINTLTFTENRYIIVETPRDGDEVVDYWHSSGKWTPATESSVTKTFAERHEDDDGNVAIEEKSFHKEYAWGAGGELFVIVWNDDPDAGETQRPHIERYTRVENPLPPLAGTWVATFEADRHTMTIGDAFTYTFRTEEDGTVFNWSFSGSWRHEEAKAFLYVDSQSVTYSDTYDAGAAEWFDNRFDGDEVRIAYAPSGVADTMVVSLFWGEVQYDGNTDTWTVNETTPYGRYDWRFVRQGS
jgi:hypothetical protein